MCIVSHSALTHALRRMICYGLGTEKSEQGKSGRWMGKGKRGSFPPAPKTFFFPFHPSWPGPTSSVRPFSTALKVPGDPPAPEAWSRFCMGALAIHPEDGANIYRTASLLWCTSESRGAFVKTQCPPFRVSCVRSRPLSGRVKIYSQVSLTLVTFLYLAPLHS